MLLDSNILSPGKGNMSIEYMVRTPKLKYTTFVFFIFLIYFQGQKFIGDLLEDGKIKSHETETIFCSPSAWAINCKKIINPEKKSGCGWASVRYNGKKLDIFKAQYHKKIQKKKEEEVNEEENEVKENLPKLFEEIVVPEKQIQKHQLICNRTVLQDINMLVETVPFSSIGRIQPFNVNVSISALLVMDFHCHLTVNEVFGYFGGTWDFNTHNLTISHCFPLLNSKKDRSNSSECEVEIQKMMIQKNIELVGWYHSHHRFPAFPTLKDCDKQLNYQIKLRGNSDLNYTPCIGFIHASYNETENIEDEAKVQPFWVLPPPENRPYELGKPLIVHTNNRDIDQDLNVLNDIKSQLKSCVDYYEGFKLDMIDFKTAKFKSEKPVLEKFKNSIFHKLPSDEVVSAEIWNWILELLKLPKEETVEFPKSFLDRIASLKNEKVEEAETAKAEEMKNSDENAEKTIESVKVPTPSAVLPLPASYKQSLSSNSTSFSSPRDSPASIPSSANSPAKFEVPSRSTPSPAKSESPSLKPRSSPAKIHLASNLKYDDWQNEQKKLHAAMFEFPRNANSNNFILPGEDSRRTPPVSIYPLPSSFGQNSTKKTSTSTSNNTKSNQKANKNANHWLSQIPNMEDFLKQLEKGDLSVLMQSPYNLPAYSQPKDDQKSSSKNYDVKSSSTSMNKKKEKAPIDPYSSLHLDALKGNSEKLLNLMKSPEYTQMLLKSAKMSNFDADTIEKLSAPYSQSLHSSRVNHSSSTSSSSRQQTMSDSLPKSSKTAQSNSSPYYPPFDMKYFNEITKQASQPGSKKNFPSNPEDFNALLQMELFSKTMSPSPSYGKSSSSVNQSRAEESRKGKFSKV
jgi:MPN domain-containing protein